MAMQIKFLNSKGIHPREISGIDTLKQKLPTSWYGYANLDFLPGGSDGGQIDVVIVTVDRIILADIKDWRGKITGDGQSWFQNDAYVDTSPVKKILQHARVMPSALRDYLGRLTENKGRKPDKRDVVRIPFFQGCVVMTNSCNLDGLPEQEKSKVFAIDDFCRILQDPAERYRRLGDPGWVDRDDPFTEPSSRWRSKLAGFFGDRSGIFKPQEKIYGNHKAVSERTHEGPNGIYEEFDASSTLTKGAFGLLRRWNFANGDKAWLSEQARANVAGREQQVLTHLQDRDPSLELALLRPVVSEPERSMRYWEVFERRRQLTRLVTFVASHGDALTPVTRTDLARSLVSHVAALHRLGAAHTDIGPHSVWLELPSTVRLSHLVAAHYPEMTSVGDRRYDFLAKKVNYPEHLERDYKTDHFRQDVFLLGLAVHFLLFGHEPEAKGENPPEWSPDADSGNQYPHLHAWFAKALQNDPQDRYADAGMMLDALNAVTRRSDIEVRTLERLHSFRRWPSVFHLYSAYPVSGPLKTTARAVAYKSEAGSEPVLVKCWPQMNWTDEKTDAPRLLSFCERAEDLAIRRLPGFCPLHLVGYTGDHLVLVQAYVDEPALADELADDGPSSPWRDAGDAALHFLAELCRAIEGLHAAEHAHGDLSPANILVARGQDGSDPLPLVVDIVDFAPAQDGEIRTPAYAPPSMATPMERDRFAVLLITEQVLARSAIDPEVAAAVLRAIATCREKEPVLATLKPLSEALAAALAPEAGQQRVVRTVKMQGVEGGPLLSDEGRYHLVRSWNGMDVVGAVAKLVLFAETGSGLRSARLQKISQSEVARAEKRKTATLADVDIIMAASDITGQFSAADEDGEPVSPDSILVESGAPSGKEMRKAFQAAIRLEGKAPQGLEVLLVTSRIAAVAVHVPLSPTGGYPLPLGFISHDPIVVERVHRMLVDVMSHTTQKIVHQALDGDLWGKLDSALVYAAPPSKADMMTG